MLQIPALRFPWHFPFLPAALFAVLGAACLGVAAQGAITGSTAAEVADGIPQPLASPGDAARGRALILARDPANCILCHGISDPAIRFAGNLAPPLDGAGARNTAAQLRLRIADSARLNPETIMPSYHRTEGLTNVAGAYRGKPILSPQQVEDLVAFLLTLK